MDGYTCALPFIKCEFVKMKDPDKTTWRVEINKELIQNNEKWSDIEYITLTDEELDEEFEDGFGSANGEPFFCWTANRVYFAVVYDGSEWVESIPRNPCDETPFHIGGE